MSDTVVATAAPKLTRKDFVTDQDVRWCPGCGDYSILAQVQKVMPELGLPREKFVFISGIGCSSRFPYYMNTYGFHSIHGRAPALATGLKVSRPDLSVWVVTGDGDGLSIGGNHLIHALRRNVGIKILLFNNRIYGLTKGQYSPTSELGKTTKSTPLGSVDYPFNPIAVAMGVDATFVARTVDVEAKHLQDILRKTSEHPGGAFIEILQNCNIFNDGAWEKLTEKELRDDNTIALEHGQPLVFGKGRDKGIRRNGLALEVVKLGGGVSEKDLIVHDERNPNPAYGFLLSRMDSTAGFPTPIGVLRAVEAPRYEVDIAEQIRKVSEKKGPGDLKRLLLAGDTWEVR
jgi:2-oxoglutarate ferredoxin oxidoreductase subunit beta